MNEVEKWAKRLDDFADLFGDDADDIETAIWVAMTERLTPRQIAARPMDISALHRELATVLYRVAHTSNQLSPGDRNVLYSAAAALVRTDKDWLLRLARPKAGRVQSYAARERNHERMRQLVEQVERDVASGTQVEAAIAQAMQDFEVSRSKAYAAWKRREGYRRWHDVADKVQSLFIDPEFRPENRKGILARLIDYLSPTFPTIRD